MPEVLEASGELAEEGIAAHVIDITSADRWYRAWQRTLRQGVRTATTPSVREHSGVLSRSCAHRHHPRWCEPLAGVVGLGDGAAVSLGVDSFGQVEPFRIYTNCSI